jgi:2-polyprenyl-6-methoxyphenol hydroxylase-like FAD-dependent oxidoreductase
MNREPYDAIVIGARCAGAPTAMLLARRGRRVLLCDRGSFPSDTVSNGAFNAPGPLYLKRWGLLDRLVAAGAPPIKVGVTHGADRDDRTEYGRAMYAPTRRLLDHLLVTAAVEAGAELREHFTVSNVVVEEGRVTGVQGLVGNREIVERGRVVVGADGRHSTIARVVGARDYDHVPMEGGGVYAYFKSLPAIGYEFWVGDGGWAMLAPSNDGLTQVATYVFNPAGRRDMPDRNLMTGTPQERFERVVGAYPDLRDRVAAARRRSRFVAHSDAPAFFREAYGAGWALVGDAGFHQGPWNGYGMSHAFRDADRLAAAIEDWLAGTRSFDESLRGYAQDRDGWCRAFWANILAVVKAYQEGRPQDAPRDGERPHVQRWLHSLRRELV